MGLTSSRTIISIKEADAKLGQALRVKLEKVRTFSSLQVLTVFSRAPKACRLHLALFRTLCPAHGMLRVWVLPGEQHDFSVPLVLCGRPVASATIHSDLDDACSGEARVFAFSAAAAAAVHFFFGTPHMFVPSPRRILQRSRLRPEGARGCPALRNREAKQ